MGSFNVGCGISNLAIQEGNETGFVILSRGSGPERVDPTAGVSYYTSSISLFKPFMPAVFGVYGGYGRLDEIRPSKTTEVLEEMFGKPIDKVLRCVTCSSGLYDSSGEIFQTYFTGSKEFAEFSSSFVDSLVPLGFEVVSDKEQEKIFSLGGYELVVRTEIKNGIVYPTWTILKADSGEAIVEEFFSQFASMALENFSNATGLFPGYDEKDWEIISKLHGFYGMFFLEKTFTGMRDYLLENDFWFPDAYKANRNAWDIFAKVQNLIKASGNVPEDISRLIYALDITRFIYTTTSLDVKEIDRLTAYGDDYEYLDLADLLLVMTNVNKMFAPSFCGTQDGDTDASLALGAITNSILSGRKGKH